ncbi:MAG: septal ring lytic transglycosylase RlpA family protein [Pseudomonadota bacterium]
MLSAVVAIALPLQALPATETHAQDGAVVKASWYGKRYRGRPTASGEAFDPAALTAAHPSLPFGTLVEVANPEDGRRVVVRVNDRGPANGRGIDLSEAAARRIGLLEQGVAEVTVRTVAGSEAWQ